MPDGDVLEERWGIDHSYGDIRLYWIPVPGVPWFTQAKSSIQSAQVDAV